MSSRVTRPTGRSHVAVLDIGRPRPAKADVTERDITPSGDWWRPQVGRAVERAVTRVYDNDAAAADEIGVDRAELGKWFTGERRPHFDRLFAVDRLRWTLFVELLQLDEAVHVEERIVRRRPA